MVSTSSSSGSTPRTKKRTPNWCKPCGSVTVAECSASSWCEMISGWPSAGSCRSWKFDSWKAQNSAAGRSLRPRPCQEGVGGIWAGLWQTSRKSDDCQQGPERIFSNKACRGLAQEGKVISVRLALFAEMMKGKAVDACHLEGSRRHGGRRRHLSGGDVQRHHRPSGTPLSSESGQGSAESVAAESGTDIKGHMRPMPNCWKRQATEAVPKNLMT